MLAIDRMTLAEKLEALDTLLLHIQVDHRDELSPAESSALSDAWVAAYDAKQARGGTKTSRGIRLVYGRAE